MLHVANSLNQRVCTYFVNKYVSNNMTRNRNSELLFLNLCFNTKLSFSVCSFYVSKDITGCCFFFQTTCSFTRNHSKQLCNCLLCLFSVNYVYKFTLIYKASIFFKIALVWNGREGYVDQSESWCFNTSFSFPAWRIKRQCNAASQRISNHMHAFLSKSIKINITFN